MDLKKRSLACALGNVAGPCSESMLTQIVTARFFQVTAEETLIMILALQLPVVSGEMMSSPSCLVGVEDQ